MIATKFRQSQSDEKLQAPQFALTYQNFGSVRSEVCYHGKTTV